MKKTLILDSSQIDAFLTCPEYWHLRYVQCLSPAGKPDKQAIYMGTFGHRMLETYYRHLSTTGKATESIDLALSINPNTDICKCNHLKHEHVAGVDCIVSRCDCKEFTPLPLDLGQKNIDEVISRVRLYFYAYATKDVVPNSPNTIEVGFSHRLYEDDDKLYVLEGRIDLLGHLGENKVFVDHKFQLRKRDLFLRSIQFKNYALVTGHHHGIINYVRFSKEVNEDTFKRDITAFSTMDLQLWERRLIKIYDSVLAAVESGMATGFLEHNWASCAGKFGYACDYSPLCEQNNTSVIQIMKQQMYVKQPEWKPW